MVKVVLKREQNKVLFNSTFFVYIDGKDMIFIKNGETREIEVEEGTHELKIVAKALVGRYSKSIAKTSEVQETMDFTAKKVCISLNTKIGMTNKIEINKKSEDNSEDTVNDAPQGETVNAVFEIDPDCYWNRRIDGDASIGINIDGKDVAFVESKASKTIPVLKGNHIITLIDLFKNRVLDTKTINFDKDDTKVSIDMGKGSFLYNYSGKIKE